jgi:hypothetical protein
MQAEILTTRVDPNSIWLQLIQRDVGANFPGERRYRTHSSCHNKRGISVNCLLTVSLMAPVSLYSSEVQQPMRATAALGRRPHIWWAAPGDREQSRAGSLHPEGQGFESP